MTMRFTDISYAAGSSRCRLLLFLFLDWMRTASPAGPGWTISHSSDGSTGGPGDVIVDFNDLNTFNNGVARSYFVLRSPDGSKQILYYRYIAADDEWAIIYNPNGDYSGGNVWDLPTTVGGHYNLRGGGVEICNETTAGVLHIGADDASPYGFFLWSHGAGDYNDGRHQLGMLPITDDIQPGDIDPVVLWVGYNDGEWVADGADPGGLSDDNTVDTDARCIGYIPSSGTWEEIGFAKLQMVNGVAVPSDVGQDANGDDVGIPCIALRRASLGNGGYKGITTFMRWNSAPRSAGDTFNTLTRVSTGEVNFEWDGATIPPIS